MIHTNYAGNAEWKVDYVQVKGDGQNVKFKCKEWLQKTNCDNRLQLDIYAPKPPHPGMYGRWKDQLIVRDEFLLFRRDTKLIQEIHDFKENQQLSKKL